MELIRTEDRSAPSKHGHSEHTCKAAVGWLAGKGYAAKSAKLLVLARELALSVGRSLAVVVVVFSCFFVVVRKG